MTKIMVSGYKVELVDEMKMDELIVDFHGPKDSPYVGVSKQIIAIKWYQRMKSFRRLMIYLKFYREYGEFACNYLTSIQLSHRQLDF